ncbi:globoside alpha-1,3-N-acetylgalactosaminyltransferase 1-like [Sinocyclocheilus anshuiensis]|uniref:globoside alpha-1,3-N-acetylgalactosaminyltransferase 1-like n=1 Tax=Sinocyclocheilus anshuiensis TaxID=1608454 RepID=UPI0007B9169C|nr:PREDICTED: globoside alpha-1,3-N-acetylgalactosaminyltransferase 1-like [Sinocyclocheilus anshuiensis]
MKVHFNLIFRALTGLSLTGLVYLGFTSRWIKLLYRQPNVFDSEGNFLPMAPWLAPIVREGTFDPTLIDAIYKKQNITIATAVFALGKYTQFLKNFLESAEQNYFVGFRVHYYVFTDLLELVPAVKLGEDHHLTVLTVASSNRWQEISLRRMERLEKLIERQLVNEADYVFSLDVDTKFYGRWGAETLGRLVGAIHPWYYKTHHDWFPYERRPESQAYIPYSEGDYYYGGAVIGGLLKDVYQLAKTCKECLDIDAAKSIEAAWQEESHLNKYFLYNKPSKLLSPEYLWDDIKSKPQEIKIIRFSQVNKNYYEVRPNP